MTLLALHPALPFSQSSRARMPGPPASLPGIALCAAVTAGAFGLQSLETRLFGRAWLEALVLAILLGAVIRTLWTPGRRFTPGIDVCAKTMLEIAVVLLGASVSARALHAAGPALLGAIAATVALAILASYALGRIAGLPHRLAVLIACGNAICGNSAIAAIAPVIGAEAREVATAIGFTAVLGIFVVLGLPIAAAALHMGAHRYGVFAGLTVYAVPQVLAATLAAGGVAAQTGTIVKLARVLMLGPVVMALSLLHRGQAPSPTGRGHGLRAQLAIVNRMAPWFILGFAAVALISAAGLIPPVLVPAARSATSVLTIVSMAALGLCVDIRAVAKAGPRVVAVASLSLLLLGALALGVIRLTSG